MKIAKDSRALFFEMLKKEAASNKEIKTLIDEILNGNIKTADVEIQSIRIAGETTKMFKTDDDKKIGIRSIAKAQLEKNQFMIVTKIQLLASVLADTSTDDFLTQGNYGSIKSIARLQNGEFSFKANDKYLLKEHINNTFVTDGNSVIHLGTHYLENPRLLIQQEKIEFDISLLGAPPAGTVFKLVLGGTGTLPN